MESRLQLDINAQPDNTTCGPTCLHAVYRYYGDEMPLPQLISEIPALPQGGTLAVLLGCHALQRGYRATIFTYNLQLFDPTWFRPDSPPLVDRIRAQMAAKDKVRLQISSRAYLEFLRLGGDVRMEDMTGNLLRRYLKRSIPILTGLSATYLYNERREVGERSTPDDVRGLPQGHFVVLSGYDAVERSVLVADPLESNPLSPGENRYDVDLDRLMCAIMLGIVTYDANLLIIRPKEARQSAADGHARLNSMSTLIVASSPKDWPFDIPDVDVIDAWDYLTQPKFSELRNVRILNLCRSYKYQTTGFYVSLLAEARGHKPLPSIQTLQDLKSQSMIRVVSDELDEEIEKNLGPLVSDEFTLSIYFGRNVAKRYDRLALLLFNLFQAPLLRVKFARSEDRNWEIRSVKAISGNDVPESHRDFVAEAARRHFSGRSVSRPKKTHTRYDLAILWDPAEKENCPSDEAALKKFCKAALAEGLATELITKDDYARLSEFDALFIRETTAVNHHTYRFARRAASEGLVVIDDPQSIARCTNKVFLAELLSRHKLPMPKTVVLHRDNIRNIAQELGFPCVIKKPDSAFSQGVIKIESPEMLELMAPEFLGESELLVAQEFLPTEFDWRIGVLDQRPLYACKYFMARGHWQIIQHEEKGNGRYGKAETLPVELAPRKAVSVAVKAANLIGDGLYGVDVKQSGGQFYVIEVNDNPNIDAGVEDQVLRDELYRRLAEVFVERIERRKAWNPDE